MKRLFPLFLFTVFLTACNDNSGTAETTVVDEPKTDTIDYRAVIDATNKTFTDAAVKGDSATIVNLYHPDANVYAPNEEKMDPKTMASMMGSFAKMGITSFTLNAREVYKGEDVVTEVGTYEMGDGKKVTDKGKYMAIWKMDGNKLKLFRDIWNSDNPYMPPPPAKK